MSAMILLIVVLLVVILMKTKGGIITPGAKGGGGGGSSKTPAPGAGSTTTAANCTSTIYPKGAKTWTPKYNGGQKISYSSGGGATSYRWDANGVTSAALEATYYLTWPTGSGKGDHLELKFWGPGHSGSACCWCMFNVDGTGKTGAGHEGPHPSTSNFSTPGKNVGSIKGKKVGIKGVIWPISGGAHLEGYMDVTATGKWQKVVTYEGQCGKDKKSSRPVGSQQIQFRVDSIEPKMECAVINEIKPPGAAAAYAYIPVKYDTLGLGLFME
jgi:hypothetical protein